MSKSEGAVAGGTAPESSKIDLSEKRLATFSAFQVEETVALPLLWERKSTNEGMKFLVMFLAGCKKFC